MVVILIEPEMQIQRAEKKKDQNTQTRWIKKLTNHKTKYEILG